MYIIRLLKIVLPIKLNMSESKKSATPELQIDFRNLDTLSVMNELGLNKEQFTNYANAVHKLCSGESFKKVAGPAFTTLTKNVPEFANILSETNLDVHLGRKLFEFALYMGLEAGKILYLTENKYDALQNTLLGAITGPSYGNGNFEIYTNADGTSWIKYDAKNIAEADQFNWTSKESAGTNKFIPNFLIKAAGVSIVCANGRKIGPEHCGSSYSATDFRWKWKNINIAEPDDIVGWHYNYLSPEEIISGKWVPHKLRGKEKSIPPGLNPDTEVHYFLKSNAAKNSKTNVNKRLDIISSGTQREKASNLAWNVGNNGSDILAYSLAE